MGESLKRLLLKFRRAPRWAKLVALVLIVNEIRGVLVAGAAIADLNAKSWQIGAEHYALAGLLLVPLLIERLWRIRAKPGL